MLITCAHLVHRTIRKSSYWTSRRVLTLCCSPKITSHVLKGTLVSFSVYYYIGTHLTTCPGMNISLALSLSHYTLIFFLIAAFVFIMHLIHSKAIYHHHLSHNQYL